jgi:hypothetical protein
VQAKLRETRYEGGKRLGNADLRELLSLRCFDVKLELG